MTIFGAGLSAFVVACGDDDSPPPGSSTSSTSSSTSSSSTSTSSSSSSTGGTDQDAEPDPIPAKLQLVNAITDLGPGAANASGALRICYQITSGATKIFAPGLPPLPNRVRGAQPFPGLFLGTGGPVDTTGADLSTLEVTPYIISAGKLEAIGLGKDVKANQDKTCADIFNDDAGGTLEPNVDYWVLPPVPAGQLEQKKSYLLILTGCPGDSTLGDKCGAGFTAGTPGLGNLKITKLELDNTTAVAANSIGVQFAHASPNGSAVIQNIVGEGVRPAIVSEDADAASAKPLGADANTNLDFQAITALKQVEGVAFATDKLTANPKAPNLAVGFGQIESLTTGAVPPTGNLYANGKAYTFIALGDPTASPTAGDPPSFNFRFFHYLGLPNDPTISKFDPDK
ncbi:MAG: hypothetical protein KIT84_24975 [Labilithrix sp.]|nr:hypothetical protein [Labilithrix sp.]MCW5814304.1 hypothetical protein [Labilithrix sp.]